ncbi:Protein of unknown function [Thermobacillus xylanilyticus]|uniref:Uncharacterized protein n=1 Tax=Thermobacillus xylanilyticus TaxID=76633 RepID=A0ABN7S497_THEXY|nr:Protein of unknown function [Thermobacillus xylanilyticus]
MRLAFGLSGLFQEGNED